MKLKYNLKIKNIFQEKNDIHLKFYFRKMVKGIGVLCQNFYFEGLQAISTLNCSIDITLILIQGSGIGELCIYYI